MKKSKKKIRDLDKYCIFCITFFTIYTIIELILSSVTGITHDRLTEAVQWFAAGELFLLAMLKRLKIKKGDDTNDLDSKQLESNTDTTIGNSRAG